MARKKISDSGRVRALIEEAGLSQVQAALALGINPRTIRTYCASDKVPRVVLMALERLVQIREEVEVEEELQEDEI